MAQTLTKEKIIKMRKQHLAPSMSLAYEKVNPLHIVKGSKQYLYDINNIEYLDCVNNVCHVGHCHPQVVKEASKQLSLLNTNTRYLHSNIVQYARKLTSLFPPTLNHVIFTNRSVPSLP